MSHTGHSTGAAASRAAGVDAVAHLDDVAVTVRRTPVLRRVDLTLRAGETVGVLGANGSGKSTLLAVLATLVPPAAGHGTVLGRPLGTAAVATVRPHIALVGHTPALYPQLTLTENLHLLARLTGRANSTADGALRAVGLAGAGGRRAESCSQGMVRRAELARVLLTEPSLLLLDEVHAGLDRDAVGLVDDVVARVRRRGGACVLVSHDAERLVGLVDRTVRVEQGGLRAGSPAGPPPR
ncbi:ABC transporter ATP-binding protein [Pseudonocardia hydrocarbonoxydans]|uniref:ABC transporter ATP-binding protein n=1 Tax=Pseudonocardia hydrocarbonoxydans TaxID=76726 RepID=UPI0031E2D07F